LIFKISDLLGFRLKLEVINVTPTPAWWQPWFEDRKSQFASLQAGMFQKQATVWIGVSAAGPLPAQHRGWGGGRGGEKILDGAKCLSLFLKFEVK